MDLLAAFAQLDATDRRRYRSFWATAGMFGEIDCVTDELLAAAFHALDRFGQETPDMVYADTGHASMGACTLIRRAMEERREERNAILTKLVAYYGSPNMVVAVAVVRALERSETCRALAVPYLQQAATDDVTNFTAEGLPLRGFAWLMLYKIDPSIEVDASYAIARHDALQILQHWFTPPRDKHDIDGLLSLKQRLEERLGAQKPNAN